MPTWLIAWRRSTGDLERFQEFADPGTAGEAQDRAKRAQGNRGRRYEGPDLEVVTITASSLEILRRGHPRYFAKADAPGSVASGR